MAKLTIDSTLRMNSGYEIPVLGYGVDSAIAYGNEGPTAAAVKRSGIPREKVFFTSKIISKTMDYKIAKDQIDGTLKTTGFDYIDLMLIHAPYGGREGRKGAWKALVEAQEEGKIRSLGISNYGIPHLKEMEEYIKELEEERGKGKGGVISVGQWEVHPWLPRPDITEWCQKRGVVVEAYAPVVRATRMEDPLVVPLSQKYGKTPAQILLRWSLQKGYVPLPKSITPERIKENAGLFDFELTDSDMKSLETTEYAPVCWDPTKGSLEE
ncbi:hypothetical protein B7463_g1251, partial [Scytalidium lignicola]